MSMTCPTCNVTLVAKSATAQKLQCPKCEFTVNYVAVDTGPAADATPQPRARDTQEPDADTDKAAEKKVPPKKIEVPKYTSVVCPTCGTRLDPRVRKKERTVKCPDCYVRVRVPPLDEVMQALEAKARTIPLEDVGQYELQTPVVANTAPTKISTTFRDVQAEIREEPPPPPPRWTFFSGVFTFPWRLDALTRWMWMSLFWIILMWILIGLILPFVSSGGDIAGIGHGIMLVCLGVLGVLVGSWGVSFSSAALLSVITDTAAGNDRVTGWPEFNFMEWLNSFIQVVYAATATMMLAWIITVFATLATNSVALAVLLTLHFGFPVVLLSTLESDLRWMPLTGPIVTSLRTCWIGWSLFYLISAATFGLLIAFDVGLMIAVPTIRPLFLGPACAAVVLIYGRLLGRVAWLSSTPDSARGKRSKHKKQRKPGKNAIHSNANASASND